MSQDTNKISVVLLGAGEPYLGDSPSGLKETPDHRLVLDWIIDAFSTLSPTWHFVGGFHAEDITQQYPELNYSLNKDWQTTNSAESLFFAPLSSDAPLFVSYTDVVYSSDVVRKLEQAEGDVVLAVDTTWQSRYHGRTQADMEIAEKITLSGDSVSALGPTVAVEDASAEYAGLAKLTPKAIEALIDIREKSRADFLNANVLELYDALKTKGIILRAVDVKGEWAELNAPQDLARYVLGTKSETLQRLRPLVGNSVIGEQVSFRVGEWTAGQNAVIATIQDRFRDKLLAVRSSSLHEDSWTTSNAGKFLSLINVQASDAAALADAINQVIASYNDGTDDNQVLVQEMVLAPVFSGVAFTRSLSTGAPYYVVNYDDKSGRTDTVTGGIGESLKVLVAHREAGALEESFGSGLSNVITALQELEGLVGHDSLDVEFAVTDDGAVHILQLRPIVVEHAPLHVSDAQFDILLTDADAAFQDRQAPPPGIVGSRTLYAIMSDWNPAEMIGTSPRRLAASLYRHLVTDDVWAIQRAEYGYRDVRPAPLMVDLAGRPYIDVRTCFNSFIPAALNDDVAARLVDHYLDRLEAHPHLHDKIEFDIVFTSLDFGFDNNQQRLAKAGFSKSEIETLRGHLADITVKGMARAENDLEALDNLKTAHRAIMDSDASYLEKAFSLLEECGRWGTLPFAHLARGAFLGTALLRSGVTAGLMPETEYAEFMRSLVTVAGKMARDNDALARNDLSREKFLGQYGHLRPGTYEITSPTYAENAEQYLGHIPAASAEQSGPTAFSWSDQTAKQVSEALRGLGLPDDFTAFDKFLRTVIEGREYGKFVFSQSLSAALDLIAAFGGDIGISRDVLSHISVGDLAAIQEDTFSGDAADWIRRKSEEGRGAHEVAQALELPPLVMKGSDFRAFHFPENQPNFIGLKKVTAAVADLTDDMTAADGLEGKILFIPQADPGFDWVFSHEIAGLITKFGGANSHMAIRAAEFGLPAAIGLGEVSYTRYRQANTLELDCAGRQIKVIG